MNCNYKIVVTLYTLETWFVQVCNCKLPAYNNNNNNNNNNERGLSNHMLCIMPAVCLTSMLSSSREGTLCNYQRLGHLDQVVV